MLVYQRVYLDDVSILVPSPVVVSSQVDHLPSGQDGACALRSIGICGGSDGPSEVPGELRFLQNTLW